MEVEIIKFSLTSSISLEGLNHIYSRVLNNIFFSKFEVLGNFLTFSQKSWFIVFVSIRKRMKNLNGYFFNLLSRLRIFWFYNWLRSFSWLRWLDWLWFWLNRLFLSYRFIKIVLGVYIVIDLWIFNLRTTDKTNSSNLIALFRFLIFGRD